MRIFLKPKKGKLSQKTKVCDAKI